jgi:hypothetical protein
METVNKNMVEPKKVLVDVKVEIELAVRRYHWQTMEQYAKNLEDAIIDFQSFLRDHRSQDVNHLSVDRIYEEQCSGCNEKWEPTDIDGVICCANCGIEIKK